MSKAALCRAALDRGLDKFVLTRAFNDKTWCPTYLDDSSDSISENGTRYIAVKTLADVVKAVVGAGKITGGYSTALTWAQALLCKTDLPSLDAGRRQLFDSIPCNASLPRTLQPLETLSGYLFKKKVLLIEATTHGSGNTEYYCYDRLAFLGNSIIESIVVDEIYAQEKLLSCCLMHRYQEAVVNRYYLGFVALEWHTTQTRTILVDGAVPDTFNKKRDSMHFSLCNFLQHHSPEVTKEMERVESQFASCRSSIARAIDSDTVYPWTLLAELRANGFCADMVESLVGAVWVDSGSMEDCRKVLDRMGILPYLRRLIREQVSTIDPKEELDVLAKSEKVKYDTKSEIFVKGEMRETTCVVYVGDRKVAEVRGVGIDEVEVKAAAEAVSLLKSAGND
jgi:dsRNA-specific ribonuclease